MMIFIGISLLVLTGLSWVGTGVVISNAAKKSIDIGSIQFFSALIMTIVSAALLIFGFWPKSASNQAIFLTGGLIMLSGFINYIGSAEPEAAMPPSGNLRYFHQY